MAKRDKHDYDITTGEGQKRLMYESRGVDITAHETRPKWFRPGEYGHDPILDENGNPTGKVRMVPTGRVIDLKNPTLDDALAGMMESAMAKKFTKDVPNDLYITKSGERWQVIDRSQPIGQFHHFKDAVDAYYTWGGKNKEPWIYLGGITGDDKFVRLDVFLWEPNAVFGNALAGTTTYKKMNECGKFSLWREYSGGQPTGDVDLREGGRSIWSGPYYTGQQFLKDACAKGRHAFFDMDGDPNDLSVALGAMMGGGEMGDLGEMCSCGMKPLHLMGMSCATFCKDFKKKKTEDV